MIWLSRANGQQLFQTLITDLMIVGLKKGKNVSHMHLFSFFFNPGMPQTCDVFANCDKPYGAITLSVGLWCNSCLDLTMCIMVFIEL